MHATHSYCATRKFQSFIQVYFYYSRMGTAFVAYFCVKFIQSVIALRQAMEQGADRLDADVDNFQQKVGLLSTLLLL